jgi:hypothetical protein
MTDLNLAEVLNFKGASDLTGYQAGKFKDPEVKAALEGAGARHLDLKPSLWEIPTSALIAAGLLTEDGESTKRVYSKNADGAVKNIRSIKVEPKNLPQTLANLTEARDKALEELPAVAKALADAIAAETAAREALSAALEAKKTNSRLHAALEKRVTTLTAKAKELAAAEAAQIKRDQKALQERIAAQEAREAKGL